MFFMIMDFLVEKGSTSSNNGNNDRKKDCDTLHYRQRTVDGWFRVGTKPVLEKAQSRFGCGRLQNRFCIKTGFASSIEATKLDLSQNGQYKTCIVPNTKIDWVYINIYIFIFFIYIFYIYFLYIYGYVYIHIHIFFIYILYIYIFYIYFLYV